MRRFLSYLLLFSLWLPPFSSLAETTEPRVVLALYDGHTEKTAPSSFIHRFAEMPLNHIGLFVEYHDVQKGLPDLKNRDDVRGILSWYNPGTNVPNPKAYLQWAQAEILAGKKFVMIGNPGFLFTSDGTATPFAFINRFLQHLHLRWSGSVVEQTYDVSLKGASDIVGFERKKIETIPPYFVIEPTDSKVTSHLWAQALGFDNASLISTSDFGGYIATGFALDRDLDRKNGNYRWYVNPFAFFKRAFAVKNMPIPDATTLNGKRIYYNQIDSAGWHNRSYVQGHEKRLSAEIILDTIIRKNPDLPASLGIVAADIDRDWQGTEEGNDIARAYYSEAHIEAAAHSYTRPYEWHQFATGKGSNENADGTLTRTYIKIPYSTENEIKGSTSILKNLLPKNKDVTLFQWTGNYDPYEKALALVREMGLENINGGTTRFDSEYNSLAYVSPIGQVVGNEKQIYASATSENSYTDNWSKAFHRFRYVRETWDNTESPRRLKPLNLHYHIYSGDYQAGYDALSALIEDVKAADLIPIFPSHYSAIATGFYSTILATEDAGGWHVTNRGALQTIRFDDNSATVDMRASKGVIGWNHYQNSLYVFLDPHEKKAFIKLGKSPSHLPILISAKQLISAVTATQNAVTYYSKGFGIIDHKWIMPMDGTYDVTIGEDRFELITKEGKQLHLHHEKTLTTPTLITIKRRGAS